MSAKTVVRTIVKDLADKAEFLSKKKYSGMTLVSNFCGSGRDVYRIHYSDVFARALGELIDTSEIDGYIWDIPGASFDDMTLWFTIEVKR